METDKNHMHLLIQYNVKDSVADIVKALKQYTTHKMWECDRTGLKQLYWKHKCLWSDGYFACSIDEASEKNH